MADVVCLLSGGMDSTVLLYLLRERYEVLALSVSYGQRHKRELLAAQAVVQAAGVQHRVVDLSALSVVLAGSSQTSADIAVPHGHYADSNMSVTVVPNRNMILLAVAAAQAISSQTASVAYAAHAGDHEIYPDCRPEFAIAMGHCLAQCHYTPVNLWRPFICMTKADIVKVGARVGAPFHLTYSCYEGGEQHCGLCGTCYERRTAFLEAGVADPTEYAHALPNYTPS